MLCAFVFVSAESEWLKWWNEVAIFENTSTTTRDPQVTSEWNVSFSVLTDDDHTQSTGNMMKWNMTFTDSITGQLTSKL